MEVRVMRQVRPPGVVAGALADRMVSYLEGRYQLYGDGKSVPY